MDGTLISCDRCADKEDQQEGQGNRQVVLRQGARTRRERAGTGRPWRRAAVGLRCAAGSTHDLTAARELVLPVARPYLKHLPVLADSGSR
jgi:hypothetical protein